MFRFLWPWMFCLLPIPALIYWYLPAASLPKSAVLKVPFYRQLESLQQTTFNKSGLSKIVLSLGLLIWLCLIVAISRPQWLGKAQPLEHRGRDILMAIDVSGSMDALDLTEKGKRLSRLDVVKQVAGQFVKHRVGDRVGLILFGTRAYLQTPLTFDRQTVIEQLQDASVGLAGSRTAVGDAIGLAIKRLKKQDVKERLLILLTDGANNSGAVLPLDAAKFAQKEKVRIDTIGIGVDSMVVNSFWGPRRVGASGDLDEGTLRAIAKTTGGRYFRARDRSGLEAIYRDLNRLEPVARSSHVFQPSYPLYPWALGLGFLLSLLLFSMRLSGSRRRVAC